MSMPDQDEPALGLAELRRRAAALAGAQADKHYDHLLQTGEDALNLDPLVALAGVAEGQVLWGRRNGLEGYAVSALKRVPPDPDFERIGFNENAQRDGIWVLGGVRYEREGEGFTDEPSRTSHIFAHYDEGTDTWHAMQRRPDAAADEEWASRWTQVDLSDEQKAVLGRIGQETGILLDAVVTLQDNTAAYLALDDILMDRAQQSGDTRRIGVIMRPHEYPSPAGDGYRVSGFGNLQTLARNVHRRLADYARRNSTDLVTAAARARLCPPYERVQPAAGDLRLSGHVPTRAKDASRAPAHRRDRGGPQPHRLGRSSSPGSARE
jgi:hypothetical protein